MFRVASRPYLKSNSNLKAILEYEVPSETNIFLSQINCIFQPNLYVDIVILLIINLKHFTNIKVKCNYLINLDQSKALKHWLHTGG